MKSCTIALLALILSAPVFAQTILPIGNSLGGSQRPYQQQDYPAIPASDWIGGLTFDSLTCNMVYVQLPSLLAWVQRSRSTPTLILNWTGEDDAAHGVPVSTFMRCLNNTIALERAYFPSAFIITPNVLPFPRYRIGRDITIMQASLVYAYNAAEAAIAPVDIWNATVELPQGFGIPAAWTSPNSDPNENAWHTIDGILRPLIYGDLGLRLPEEEK